MAVPYKKLWKMLIDIDMKTITRMNNGENSRGRKFIY